MIFITDELGNIEKNILELVENVGLKDCKTIEAIDLFCGISEKNDVLKEKDLYYAFIETPQYWSIRADGVNGAIYDNKTKMANIYFKNPIEKRMVSRVEWIDANGKCKSPMEFIPVFEANGFIYKLDCFMWEMVCKVIRRWLDTGRQPLPISVNVSRTYLQKEDVAGYIKNLIDKYQIPMELFQLEITETTENAESLSYINSLKQADSSDIR